MALDCAPEASEPAPTAVVAASVADAASPKAELPAPDAVLAAPTEVEEDPDAVAIVPTATVFASVALAVLPHEKDEVSGCLVPGCGKPDDPQPSSQGTLLYLNCEGRLDEAGVAFVEAEATFERFESASHRAAAWIAKGDLAARRGDDSDAARLYRRAAEALQDFRF